jgi:hypothetical protein
MEATDRFYRPNPKFNLFEKNWGVSLAKRLRQKRDIKD